MSVYPMLAGIHFTGSTAVFRKMWKDVANNLESGPILALLEKQEEKISSLPTLTVILKH